MAENKKQGGYGPTQESPGAAEGNGPGGEDAGAGREAKAEGDGRCEGGSCEYSGADGEDAGTGQEAEAEGDGSRESGEDAGAGREAEAEGGSCEFGGADEAGTEDAEDAEGGQDPEDSEESESEGDEAPEDGAQGEPSGDGKARFFKKKEKKNKLEEKVAELTDRVQRQMAEFDNFRKRTEKEKEQMYEIGAKSVIEKILPVVDNFERGMAAAPEGSMEDPFVQGMDKIYKQLVTELEGLGVKPIEAVGAEFNPEYHNAVMQVESDELESGMVAQELQKGYMYRDSVVRHSMVAVVE